MRLYVTNRGRWAGTQADASQLAREDNCRFKQVEVPTDKAGLLAWLNLGPIIEAPAPEPHSSLLNINQPLTTAVPQPCKVQESIRVDEDFDRLPLARQLDLAARAMENARAAL